MKQTTPKRAVFFKTAQKMLLTAGFTVITNAAMAANITPFSATYALNIDGRTGTATRTLSQNGNSFTYRVSARAAGIATANQSSTFSLTNGRVSPSSANTSYRIAGVGTTHNIRFSGRQVVSTYRGKSVTLPTPQGAYDDLSLEMQIRQELLNGRFSGRYSLVKKDAIESTTFRRVGNARISVPAGTYDTVRIDRIHGDSSRATSFWLAPSLDYLPVKVSQTDDGKTISMSLSSIQ